MTKIQADYENKVKDNTRSADKLTEKIERLNDMREKTCGFMNTSPAVTLIREAKQREEDVMKLADDCGGKTGACAVDTAEVDTAPITLRFPTRMEFSRVLVATSRCYSVLIVPNGNVWTGCQFTLDFYYANSDDQRSFRSVRDVVDMAVDGDSVFVMADRYDETHLMQFDWRKEKYLKSVKVFHKGESSSVMAAHDGTVALTRDDRRLIELVSAQTGEVHCVHPPLRVGIDGLCYAADNSLLISDAEGNELMQYDLEKQQVMWRRNTFNAARISVNSDGLIYVCTRTKRQVYVLSPNGILY